MRYGGTRKGETMPFPTFYEDPESYNKEYKPGDIPDITIAELKAVLRFWDVDGLDELMSEVEGAADDWKVSELHKRLGIGRVTLDFLIISYKHHEWKKANPDKGW